MEIYLVQHGESKSEIEDPERPLTDKGKVEVESVARHVAALGIKVGSIIHSGKLRAKQSAELFARYLLPPHGVREEKGLAPLDDPHQAKHLIEQAQSPLMIVGHLPHLSRLVSLLTLDNPEKEVIRFRMGSIVCLGRSGDDSWSIEWFLIPQLIQG
jgi:phosphohistidine phosphatase